MKNKTHWNQSIRLRATIPHTDTHTQTQKHRRQTYSTLFLRRGLKI